MLRTKKERISWHSRFLNWREWIWYWRGFYQRKEEDNSADREQAGLPSVSNYGMLRTGQPYHPPFLPDDKNNTIYDKKSEMRWQSLLLVPAACLLTRLGFCASSIRCLFLFIRTARLTSIQLREWVGQKHAVSYLIDDLRAVSRGAQRWVGHKHVVSSIQQENGLSANALRLSR
jgi:hypothetical protein